MNLQTLAPFILLGMAFLFFTSFGGLFYWIYRKDQEETRERAKRRAAKALNNPKRTD